MWSQQNTGLVIAIEMCTEVNCLWEEWPCQGREKVRSTPWHGNPQCDSMGRCIETGRLRVHGSQWTEISELWVQWDVLSPKIDQRGWEGSSIVRACVLKNKVLNSNSHYPHKYACIHSCGFNHSIVERGTQQLASQQPRQHCELLIQGKILTQDDKWEVDRERQVTSCSVACTGACV